MTLDERSLLEWLSKEDFSQYGECHGKTLDRLVEQGLAQVHGPGEHQSFIAKGTSMMYRAVSVTDAGRMALAADDLERAERERDATHSQLVELQRDHQAVLSERDAALDCARRLATALWEKHYKNDAPHWTVGDDLVLVISQIDNMTAGMARAQTAA